MLFCCDLLRWVVSTPQLTSLRNHSFCNSMDSTLYVLVYIYIFVFLIIRIFIYAKHIKTHHVRHEIRIFQSYLYLLDLSPLHRCPSFLFA